MTITIELPFDVETRAKTQAFDVGENLEIYLKTLIDEETIRRERVKIGSEKSFREILAPIHKGFKESRMSEDELLELLENEREALWQEQQLAK
jgi:hypothetical protein